MKTRIKKVFPPGGRIIAVSDIHGYVDYLDGLLKKTAFSPQDTLILIGDLIEKGPESLKTVRYVMELCAHNQNVHVSMGNVEYHRIGTFFNDSKEGNEEFLRMLLDIKRCWKRGLFLDMLDELGIPLDTIQETGVPEIKKAIWDRYREEITFLWELPAIITAGNYIFVHAGIETDDLEKLRDKEAFSHLKINAFLNMDVHFRKCVVVGHWPVGLYHDTYDSMNPVFDYEKHIVAIDGGCALKTGAQLNALIIPHQDSDMKEIRFESFDDYPRLTAEKSQERKESTVCIRYFDCKVVILEEKGDVAKVMHESSGKVFTVPVSFLYRRKAQTACLSDFNNGYLQIEEGDELALIQETSEGAIVKKDGLIGWYDMGKRKKIYSDNADVCI